MPPDPDTLPAGTEIGRTALRASDPPELARFYRDVIGLEILQERDAETVLGVGETPLLVLEQHAGDTQADGSNAGLYHNAFSVPTRAALGDALTRIQEDWELDGASDHGVSEALYLTDPEGNGIEIYRDFPRADWPSGQDGSLEMVTEPLDLQGVAGAAAGESGMPEGTDVGHVHLEVTSLGAFRDLFVDTLGFEVQTRWSGALFISAGGYHHHLGANTWNNRTEPVEGTGLSWFEVVLPDGETLDRVREDLRASQYPLPDREEGLAVIAPDDIEVRFRVASDHADAGGSLR